MRVVRTLSTVAATLALVASTAFATGSGAATYPESATPGTDEVLAGDTMSGDAIPCTAQPDGVRFCHGSSAGDGGADLRLKSFDGVPLDIYVTLPSVATAGARPLIVQSHGWGAPPSGPTDAQYGGPTAAQWAAKGYVVVQLAARGWGDSCGTEASRQVDAAACAKGYIRLDDVRYEVRDIQYVAGLLVDDGLVDPARIGAIGESYGGASTLALATLRDRVMQPDGSLVPWRSPDGVPLQVAAAVPLYTFSDLVTALAPNGRTFVDRVTPPADDLSPVGVWKQSIDTGLHLVGQLNGYYAPQGSDPEADIDTWFAALSDGNPAANSQIPGIVEQAARYHSPYHLLAGTYGVEAVQPPPLLFVQGFTDEVFPVDETLRYVQLERTLFPDAQVGMFFLDGGHQRGQNKAADGARVGADIEAFFEHHLAGVGAAPVSGVTALTQTCPDDAPSGGPFHATSLDALAAGSVSYRSDAATSVRSDAGDPAVAKTLDPVLGGLACTTVPATDQHDGVATYRLPAAQGAGFTLLGAPTVTVDIATTGTNAFLAARLFDVDPATGKAVLVTRGVYRVDPAHPDGTVTFPLQANGWHFAAGHIPKLELLGNDAPYLGASPVPFTVKVSGLELTLPTHEATPQQTAAGENAPAAVAVPARPSFTG